VRDEKGFTLVYHRIGPLALKTFWVSGKGKPGFKPIRNRLGHL